MLGENPSVSGETAHWICCARSIGDDRVIVLATEKVQNGVQAMVDDLAKHLQLQARTTRAR